MSLGCGKRKGKVAKYGNLVLSWPHCLTDKNSSFACSPHFQVKVWQLWVSTKVKLVKFTHYHLFPVFLFSSFSSVSKSQRLELPFIFNKSPACFVLRDFSEYSRCFFFFNVMQSSKICLSQGSAQLVNARSSICRIMYSRHFPLRIDPPILGWTIVTPQGR